MALLNPTHWQVEVVDSASWQTIATKLDISKTDLLAANGLTSARALVTGEVIHVPLGRP